MLAGHKYATEKRKRVPWAVCEAGHEETSISWLIRDGAGQDVQQVSMISVRQRGCWSVRRYWFRGLLCTLDRELQLNSGIPAQISDPGFPTSWSTCNFLLLSLLHSAGCLNIFSCQPRIAHKHMSNSVCVFDVLLVTVVICKEDYVLNVMAFL